MKRSLGIGKTHLAKPAGLGMVKVYLAALALLSFAVAIPSTVWAQCPSYLSQWGSFGTLDGQFNQPFGAAIDAGGDIYVADLANNRIQKFDGSGAFITKWGSFGTGSGQFDGPTRVATDASGNVYVTDIGNDRVQKFDGTGVFITAWGSTGPGDGQFNQPHGVATDASGFVYVTDINNGRIQKFTSTGTFVTKWGSLGSADGQFINPRGVATDASGNVYVADTGNDRIQKFDANGVFIAKWGATGAGSGLFSQPFGVSTDAAGNVYVADFNNSLIQKFDNAGAFVCQFGSAGSGNGQFAGAIDMVIDAGGNVFAVDFGNSRIQKFGAAGVVSVSGTVTSNCAGPLQGVTVDLLDGGGVMYTTTTNAAGEYLFTGIPASLLPGDVSIMAPLGFEADPMAPLADIQYMIDLDASNVQDFPLLCLVATGKARNKGYWKHEAAAHLNGKGKTTETFEDMTVTYPMALFNHFYENNLNGIQVPGVTFVDNGGGPEAISLEDMGNLLSAKKVSNLEKAKMEYLSMLLNLASAKLFSSSTASKDGATLSQALQYVAELITDGDESDHKLAKDIAKTINKGKLVKEGIIPSGITQIAYAQAKNLEFSVSPNPGARSGQMFAFTTYARGDVRLNVYDVAGRIIATPVYQELNSGKHRIRWDGRSLDGRVIPSGVYLARLSTPTSDATLKLMRVSP